MKKVSVWIGIMILSCSGFSQSLGFQENECEIVQNPDYFYDNFSYGSHGSGYNLYHYATVIYSRVTDLSFVHGYDLRFTDDAGFFLDYGYSSEFNLYKVHGDHCVKIGNGTGQMKGLYVLNDHVCYFAMDFNFSGWEREVTIARCSDLAPSKVIVYQKSPDSNLTVFDTIPGSPLCAGLKTLHFKLKSGSDTLTYTIHIQPDSSLSVQNLSANGVKVYPNPANDHIRFSLPSGFSATGITLINQVGEIVREYKTGLLGGNEIFTGDLQRGIYLLKIVAGSRVWTEKILIVPSLR
jgi:hypothetical protein